MPIFSALVAGNEGVYLPTQTEIRKNMEKLSAWPISCNLIAEIHSTFQIFSPQNGQKITKIFKKYLSGLKIASKQLQNSLQIAFRKKLY